MKRLILLASIVALGACSATTAPTAPSKIPTIHRELIPCTTEDGRSGYMITSGDKCDPNLTDG